MSSLKDRALAERVTLPFDNSFLWSPEGRLRIINRTPGPIKSTPSGKSIQLVYHEVQLAPLRMAGFGLGFTSSGGIARAVSNTDSPVDPAVAGASGTATFTNAAIGVADGDRVVVACASVFGSFTAASITGATIGGSAAAQQANQSGVAAATSIYTRKLATGTTATVAVTYTAATAASAAALSVYRVIAASETAAAVNSANAGSGTSAGLNCNTTGDCLGVGYCATMSFAARSHTWAGLTEDIDETVEGTSTFHSSASAAITTPATPRTITANCSASSTSFTGVAAIFA